MQIRDEFLKINQNNAAVINRMKVLKLIIDKGSIKRSDISKLTGLQTSTLTYIIQNLKNLNLINESVLETSVKSKGVKPNTITLNKDDNFVLGFDIKLKEILVVIANLSGEMISAEKFKLKFNKNTIIDELSSIYKIICKKYKKKILGVTIGIPGIVDHINNEIVVSDLLRLKNYTLASVLKDKLKIPVFLENNANLAAYHAYAYKYKDNVRNLLYLFIHLNGSGTVKDMGIGSGLIINRSIFHGDSFAAGEFGDAFKSLLHNVPKDIKNKFLSSSVVDLLEKYKKDKNDKCVKALFLFFQNLGKVLSNAINIINPAVIVIGSDHVFEDELFNPIKDGIRNSLVEFIKDKTEIFSSQYNEYSIAEGASRIAGENILSYEYFNELLKEVENI